MICDGLAQVYPSMTYVKLCYVHKPLIYSLIWMNEVGPFDVYSCTVQFGSNQEKCGARAIRCQGLHSNDDNIHGRPEMAGPDHLL